MFSRFGITGTDQEGPRAGSRPNPTSRPMNRFPTTPIDTDVIAPARTVKSWQHARKMVLADLSQKKSICNGVEHDADTRHGFARVSVSTQVSYFSLNMILPRSWHHVNEILERFRLVRRRDGIALESTTWQDEQQTTTELSTDICEGKYSYSVNARAIQHGRMPPGAPSVRFASRRRRSMKSHQVSVSGGSVGRATPENRSRLKDTHLHDHGTALGLGLSSRISFATQKRFSRVSAFDTSHGSQLPIIGTQTLRCHSKTINHASFRLGYCFHNHFFHLDFSAGRLLRLLICQGVSISDQSF